MNIYKKGLKTKDILEVLKCGQDNCDICQTTDDGFTTLFYTSC